MSRLFETPRMSYLILASAKSGTTWLQRLLSSHPEVHCSETRAVADYFSTENPAGLHISLETYVGLLSRHYFPPVPAEQSAAFHRTLLFNLIDAITETGRKASGKPIHGEKLTPFPGTGQQAVERLYEYNPNLRLVNLVRDGRDVIVSGFAQRANARIQRGGDDAAAHRQMLEEQRVADAEFQWFMRLWIDSVRAGLEAARRFPHTLQLRYETYLEHPGRETERLLKFIGADASAARTQACVAAGSFNRLSGGRAAGEEDRSSFFRKGVAGDWRRWLSPQQITAFNDAAGDLLDALGYARQ